MWCLFTVLISYLLIRLWSLRSEISLNSIIIWNHMVYCPSVIHWASNFIMDIRRAINFQLHYYNRLAWSFNHSMFGLNAIAMQHKMTLSWIWNEWKPVAGKDKRQWLYHLRWMSDMANLSDMLTLWLVQNF